MPCQAKPKVISKSKPQNCLFSSFSGSTSYIYVPSMPVHKNTALHQSSWRYGNDWTAMLKIRWWMMWTTRSALQAALIWEKKQKRERCMPPDSALCQSSWPIWSHQTPWHRAAWLHLPWHCGWWDFPSQKVHQLFKTFFSSFRCFSPVGILKPAKKPSFLQLWQPSLCCDCNVIQVEYLIKATQYSNEYVLTAWSRSK